MNNFFRSHNDGQLKAGNIVEFIFKKKPIICYIEDVDIKTNKIQVMKLVRDEASGLHHGPSETSGDYDFFKTKSGYKNFDVSKRPLKIIGYSPTTTLRDGDFDLECFYF